MMRGAGGNGGRGRGDSRNRINNNPREGGGRRSRSRSPRGTANQPRRSGTGGGDRDRRGSAGRNLNDKMVYITNIPYEVRWMELKTLIREKGGEINFLEMLEDQSGKPKGNAIVEFQNSQGAEQCVKNMANYAMNGRKLICRAIRDPEAFFRKAKEECGIDFLAKSSIECGTGKEKGDFDRKARTGSYDLFGLSPDFLRMNNIEPPLCDRIFIANLAFNVGTGKVYDIFGMAGKITWMDLHMDKEGRSKGVCVIQYSHPIEAVQAVSMFNGQRLYDRLLSVKMDKYEKTEKVSDGALPRGLEGLGVGLGADGNPMIDISSFLAMRAAAAAQAPQPLMPELSTHQYPPPMPQSYSNIGSVGVNIASGSMVESSYGGNYDNRGIQPMLGMNSSLVGMPSMSSMPPPQGISTLGFSNGANSVGISHPMNNTTIGGNGFNDYMKNDVIELGDYGGGGYKPVVASRIVVVNNLPIDYTWQIVRDRIQSFGEVEAVDPISPGVFRARFRHVQEAERTRTALSGTSVEGRSITVDFI